MPNQAARLTMGHDTIHDVDDDIKLMHNGWAIEDQEARLEAAGIRRWAG